MEIEFGRHQYYFEVKVPDNRHVFHGGDREELIRIFPEIFSNTLKDVTFINVYPFDIYENQHVYRFWLRDMIVDTKVIHVAVDDGAQFLQGLFTALAAWSVPFETVLLSNLYYNGQWFAVSRMNNNQ